MAAIESAWLRSSAYLAFTDRANTDDLDSGEADPDPHINLYGGSASISRFMRTSSLIGELRRELRAG